MTTDSKPLRATAVYALTDAFVVVAKHKAGAGFWMVGRPVRRLAATASDTELGAAVRAALSESLRGIQTPRRDDYLPRLRALSKAAGVRTWTALEKAARLCTVWESREGSLRIVPHRHSGPIGTAGYHELTDAAFEFRESGDSALGAAVRRAIDLSS